MRMGVEPGAKGLRLSAILATRGHEFRGRIDGDRAAVSMRITRDGQGDEEGWVMLGEAPVPPLAPGRITDVEFWHADQALQLWVDGRRVAAGEYNWSPALRLVRTTLVSVTDAVAALEERDQNPLTQPDRYARPVALWAFAGVGGAPTPPLRLHAVALDRDIYYQPTAFDRRAGVPPARATHPSTTHTLGPDQFFVCGDNSPASEDARLWGDPDPWVAYQIDPTPGVVPRDLLIGKAFFVYFPSLLRGASSGLPVPDFGRMRFIW